MAKGFVYIAGAGPGNRDYLTLKTQYVLSICDCVIYDSLIDQDVLNEVPIGCEKIYVGKRKGQHSKKQAEINELLVEKAQQHDVIVRLKGGDPFVFGRGGEECQILQDNHIDYELIPGVTSAIAVAEMAGIPVTHRAVSRYFTVITGHVNSGRIENEIDFDILTRDGGTIVFLMGLTKLRQICRELQKHGLSPQTPVAIISNGTATNEHVIHTRLDAAASAANGDSQCVSPAIIVIGQTAAYDLRSSARRPLANRHLAVIGTRDFTAKMAEKLKRYGAVVNALPIVEIAACDQAILNEKLNRLNDFTHLVFTSRNTIRIFFDRFYKDGHDLRELGHLKIAVIGQATADYLQQYHFKADYVPGQFTSKDLGKLLIKVCDVHSRLLIPRAKKGNSVLHDVLKSAHLCFDEFALYDTYIRPPMAVPEDTDALIFASSQGVSGYFEKGGQVPLRAKIFCIGEYTQKMAQHYHENPLAAKQASADGLTQLVLEELGHYSN